MKAARQSVLLIVAALHSGIAAAAPADQIGTAATFEQAPATDYPDVDSALFDAVYTCINAVSSSKITAPGRSRMYLWGASGFRRPFAEKSEPPPNIPDSIKRRFGLPLQRWAPVILGEYRSPSSTIWIFGQGFSCDLAVHNASKVYEINRRFLDHMVKNESWIDMRPAAIPPRPVWDTIIYKIGVQETNPSYGVRIKIRALDDLPPPNGIRFPSDYLFLTMNFIAGDIQIGPGKQATGQ